MASNLEDKLATLLDQYGIPYIREFRFHPKRRWMFDFFISEHNIAIEIEGGVWTRGRHTRGIGFQNDCDKYNSAILMGFKVLRFTTSHFTKQKVSNTMDIIETMIGRHEITNSRLIDLFIKY